MADINSVLSGLTTEDLKALQAKIIGSSLAGNEYLPDTDAGGGLETNDKTVIGAVNQIFSEIASVKLANQTFLTEFHDVIGDRLDGSSDQASYSRLISRIEGNVKNFFAALIEIWDSTDNNETRLAEAEAEIERLKNNIGGNLVEVAEKYTYEDSLYTGETFEISCRPVSRSSVSVYINGVHYDNDCFKFSNENKTIQWLHSDDAFNIASEFKAAESYNPIGRYYTLVNGIYTLDENVTKQEFDSGDYYEINEDNSDKIVVRYTSIDPAHKSKYRDLYDISLKNSVGVSIGRTSYQSTELTNTYNYSNMSVLLNQNLIGKFEYDDTGRTRIEISANENSKVLVLSAKNWIAYASMARTFIAGDSSISSFDDFCNAVYGTTTNDKTWVSFFGFEVGGYDNVIAISDKTNLTNLAVNYDTNRWYYGWDEKKTGNERALLMSNKSYNPYLDLTQLEQHLVNAYNA